MREIELLIEVAKREIGQREVGGNNRGPAVEKYQTATWKGPSPGDPWCASFCSFIAKEWLNNPEVQQRFNLLPSNVEGWRPKEPGVAGWLAWAKAKGHAIYDNRELVKAGDFVVFDFEMDKKNDHIGLCVNGQVKPDSPIITIEGNVGATDGRDANTGDVVALRLRKDPIISYVIRLIQ